MESGGQFVVTLKLGVCTSQAGVASALEATIAATAADYVQVVTGAGSLGMAYINGRPKVEGDLRLVLRLGTYFAPQS